MQHRWVFQPSADCELVESLSSALNNLPNALTEALVLRGISTYEEARLFFRPSLEQLHDPFLMKGMETAADRIVAARDNSEKVMVYGDYDVDGTTSTALMVHFLKSIGITASFWIPHRIKNGYGLCNAGIDVAKERGASLIVALDCGITAVDEAAYAKQKGIDLIICDHHKPGDVIPDATAVLDPKQEDCTYPFDELSGCGVGFKLIQAVLLRLEKPAEEAFEYLDLVAISTASDIVPLEGENRILMREGIEKLRTTSRKGLRGLARVAKIDLEHVAGRNILFGMGPRINAAGRLEDAGFAVELLLSESDASAYEMAQQLDESNTRRREMDRDVLREAVVKAERQLSNEQCHCLVVHDEGWHPGIVGIVASRLVERFYRPAIVLTTVNGEVKGSARSILGVNIYNAIKACSELLVQFGGHDYAAGLSMEDGNVSLFRDQVNEAVGSQITPELLVPVIEVDAPVSLNEIDKRFWAVLKQFAPFGPANTEPVFHAENLELSRAPMRMGRDGSHIKFWVRQRTNSRQVFEAVGFGMHDYFGMLQESMKERIPLEMVFSLSENQWNGVRTLQLKARDLRLQKRTIRQ